MRSLLILINKYFWRGYIGPIFAFVIPFILTLFIGRIIGPSLIVPGCFSIPTLCILLVFMPQSVFEFRNSSILKRIGATPIKPIKFLLAIGLFNAILVIISFLVLFVLCFAIFHDSLINEAPYFIKTTADISVPPFNYVAPSYMWMITHADWASFIYSQLLMIVLSILIGLFLSSVARSTLAIQTIGISILLVSLFVGPAILPINMVGTISVVKYFGYIIPLKYPISLGIEAFTGGTPNSIVNITNSSIWNIHSSYYTMEIFNSTNFVLTDAFQEKEIFNEADKILNLVMPWVWILIFLYLTICTFSWTNRGKVVFKFNVFNDVIKQKKGAADAKLKFNKNDKSKYIIEVNECTKEFKQGRQRIIANNNITLKIPRKGNLAILGANGAGKTVLTEMLVGINKPDFGNITYNFDFIKSFKESIGIQFQDSHYPFGIRCKDIISFFIRAYHLHIPDDELMDMIKQFGIYDFYKKNASSLSGGQQQRLNLLLSILHKPKIVFLDELSTGLDIKIRNSIKKFIKDYAKKNNMTIVIVSHDMNEVQYLCKYFAIIKKGEIVDTGKISDILKKHKDLEKFINDYL